MDSTLRITLIANAGLLMTYRGTTLMIDGIYGREGHPFSNLSPEVWREMLGSEDRFQKVDYLLFTHAHPDHFSPEMTGEFLRHRDVKGLFLPQPHTAEEDQLVETLQARKTPCVILSDATEHAAYRIEPEITVRAFRTLHLDRKYRDVPHFCYILTFGDKKILLTADVDYTTETLGSIQDLPIKAAFVNPLFFNALCRRKFFKGTLPGQSIFVYHVPFPEDDSMWMLPTLRRSLEAWPPDGRPVTALTEPFQEIEL